MIIPLTYKLQAGALQLVMYVIIVIGVLLSMFILYFHLNTKLIVQHESQIEAISLADESMHRALQLNFNYQDSVVLKPSKHSTVVLKKSHWGIYDVVTSNARVRDKFFEKLALTGGKTPLKPNLALYLQDNEQALQVVGNTKITGDAYVGKYGIRPGMISGTSYTNNRLVYGNTFNSVYLLKLELTKAQYLKQLQAMWPEDLVEFTAFDLNQTKTFQHSFKEPTQYFYSAQTITLFNKALYGNIIIQSDEQIYVDGSSKLEHVILIAPKVVIGENFSGQLQAFATEELIVESKVNLSYPSALLLCPSERMSTDELPHLKLKGNSIIKGTIGYLRSDDAILEKNTFSHVQIEEGTSVYGQVYSAYNLELKGKVYGHVITNQLITAFKGSIYINHLYNAQITAEPVSNDFGGLVFNEKQIVSWVE